MADTSDEDWGQDFWTYLECDFEVDGVYYAIEPKEPGKVRVIASSGTFLMLESYTMAAGLLFYDEPGGSYSGDVVIPSTVTYEGQSYTVGRIGYAAFCKSPGLRSVTIPESVTEIWDAAFFSCENLREVKFPDGMKELGLYMFIDCKSIERLDFAGFDKLRTVDLATCESLKNLTLPTSAEAYLWDLPQHGFNIHIGSQEPPTGDVWFSDEVYVGCTLLVPAEALDAYRSDSRWGRFARIEAENTAGAVNRELPDDGGLCVDGTMIKNIGSKSERIFLPDGRVVAELRAGESVSLPRGFYISFGRKILLQ
ncbi:MAG: leucine-rich repeat domain-containing protein [Muribaculaceae bacterium]|nr:leucine-rich repeat domain-containing protein [Muribaculaceae bacterium]